MAFRLGVSSQNAACNALVDLIDGGATTNAAGQINIYTGSQPATPATTASGTLLVTIPFNNPAFGNSSAGVATMATGTPVSATVGTSGTAGWFRVVDRSGTTAIFDGSITATGGGGDMTFDNVSFVSGGTATINSMTVTVPM